MMRDYFKLLSVEKVYDIDAKELDKQYYAAQLLYHPDKSANLTEKQRNTAISSEINKAYRLLKDPLARAEHLLALSGIDLEDDDIKKILTTEQLHSIWDDMERVEETMQLSSLQEVYRCKILEQNRLFDLLRGAFQIHNIQDATKVAIQLKFLKTLINSIQDKIALCK